MTLKLYITCLDIIDMCLYKNKGFTFTQFHEENIEHIGA